MSLQADDPVSWGFSSYHFSLDLMLTLSQVSRPFCWEAAVAPTAGFVSTAGSHQQGQATTVFTQSLSGHQGLEGVRQTSWHISGVLSTSLTVASMPIDCCVIHHLKLS